MKPHPFVRAYLAGIFTPTLALPILLTVFIVARIVIQISTPIEQVLIFPMAVVPSLFGLWNMVWQASHMRTGAPIGLHGAVLPLFMAPIGALIATHLGVLQFSAHGLTWFQVCSIPYALVVPGFLFAMAAYYLVWKYIVGTLNQVLGIA